MTNHNHQILHAQVFEWGDDAYIRCKTCGCEVFGKLKGNGYVRVFDYDGPDIVLVTYPLPRILADRGFTAFLPELPDRR